MKSNKLVFSLIILLACLSGCSTSSTTFICASCNNESSGSMHADRSTGSTLFICDECYNAIQKANTPLKATNKTVDSIDYATSLVQFKDGYGCVIDGDLKTHYINSENHIICEGNTYTSNFDIHAPSELGNNTLIVFRDGAFHLIDFQGKVIKSFSKNDYNAVGAPNEGLVMAQGVEKTLSGNSTYVAYYDETGQEILKFDGRANTGESSNFQDGIAFLCSISTEDPVYNSGWPINWTMIDQTGDETEISYVNPELLKTLDSNTRGYSLLNVRPFLPDEEYTSAVVKAFGACFPYSPSDGDDYDRVVAYVSRDGKVYLTEETNADISDCYKGHIIIDADKILDVTSGTILNVTQIPEFSDASRIVHTGFMNDGNFLVAMQNQNNDCFLAIIDPSGNIVKEPTSVPAFSHLNSNIDYKAVFFHNVYEWMDEYVNTPILTEDTLFVYQATSGLHYWENTYGYCDLWGWIRLEPIYHYATPFVNNHALVATDFEPMVSSKYFGKYSFIMLIDKTGTQIQ